MPKKNDKSQEPAEKSSELPVKRVTRSSNKSVSQNTIPKQATNRKRKNKSATVADQSGAPVGRRTRSCTKKAKLEIKEKDQADGDAKKNRKKKFTKKRGQGRTQYVPTTKRALRSNTKIVEPDTNKKIPHVFQKVQSSQQKQSVKRSAQNTTKRTASTLSAGRLGNIRILNVTNASMIQQLKRVHSIVSQRNHQRVISRENEEEIPNFDEANPQAESHDSFVGVDVKLSHENEDEDCPVCLEPFKEKSPLKGTGVCDHVFHSDCIKDCLKHDHKCPVCREVVVKKLGPCPNGYMYVSKKPFHCEGYNDCGTITVRYQLISGVQGRQHPNPGVAYRGDYRVAYLPDNEEGRNVLKLFKKAWLMKLTFRVGRSLTSGQNNVITWNDIHHKTSVNGGAYGYPDPTYLQRVTLDMNSMGINLND